VNGFPSGPFHLESERAAGTIPHLDANRTQIQNILLQLNAAITEAKKAAPPVWPQVIIAPTN
jgi:hypothetical protein